MTMLLNVWVKGALSEIFFYIAVAIILIPFAIIDSVILRKISSLKTSIQIPKKFKIVKIIVSILIMFAVVASAGCLMQFVFHIDILQDDMSLLVLFALAISVFSITMCIFDLIRYFKLKKICSKNRIEASSNSDADDKWI